MNYKTLMQDRVISNEQVFSAGGRSLGTIEDNICFKPSTEKKLKILRESRKRYNQINTTVAPINHLEWNRRHWVSSGTR